MDKLYSNARQHLVLALGAAFSLSMGAFYLYARSIHHEPTRKSLLFAQATVFLVMLLYQVLRRYLYVVLIKQADWSAAARKWLKRAYFVFCCCVLSVHPIGRGLAVVLPATSEPYFIMRCIFTCFGAFCVLFTSTVMADVAYRTVVVARWFLYGRRMSLASEAKTSLKQRRDSIGKKAREIGQKAKARLGRRGSGSSEAGAAATEIAAGDAATSAAAALAEPITLKQRRGGRSPSRPRSHPAPTSAAAAAAAAASSAGNATSIEDTSNSGAAITSESKADKPVKEHPRPWWLSALVFGATIVITCAGVYEATLDPTIVHAEVPLARLPASLDGFRIVQLSDVHVGPTVGASRLQRVVEIANRLDGDIVVLTGDFLDGDEETYKPGLEPLRNLTTRTGRSYFVTGNHEYYDGMSSHKMAILRGLGVTVLHNERVVVPEYTGSSGGSSTSNGGDAGGEGDSQAMLTQEAIQKSTAAASTTTLSYPYPRTSHEGWCKTCSPYTAGGPLRKGAVPAHPPNLGWPGAGLLGPGGSSASARGRSGMKSASSSKAGGADPSHTPAKEVFDSSAASAIDKLRAIVDEVIVAVTSRLTSEAPLVVDDAAEARSQIGHGGVVVGEAEHVADIDQPAGGGAVPVAAAHEQHEPVVPEGTANSEEQPATLRRLRDETFDLAGVPDWAAASLAGDGHASNLTAALVDRDLSRELVLLAHQPKQIHEAGAAGVGLQISGHVHGGQVAPLQLPVWMANPYFAGLYRHETWVDDNTVLEGTVDKVEKQRLRGSNGSSGTSPAGASPKVVDPLPWHWWPTFIYVSRGSLYWGPQMRLGAPHEVTLITLRAGAVVGPQFAGFTQAFERGEAP